MSAVPNHALRQLRAGKLAIGLGVSQSRTVAIAQIAKTSGFDWMFIDCEHSSMDLDTAAQISTAALTVGVTPVVRVAGLEHWHASRILDNGAQGIVVPHVESRQEAQRVANSCRFLPSGALHGRRPRPGWLQVHAHRRCRARSERGDAVVVMIDARRRRELRRDRLHPRRRCPPHRHQRLLLRDGHSRGNSTIRAWPRPTRR